MTRKLWTVRFETPKLDTIETRVLAVSRYAARVRAVQKVYGKRAFWWADSGLPGWGQVCVPSPETNSNRCITARIYADILEGRQ